MGCSSSQTGHVVAAQQAPPTECFNTQNNLERDLYATTLSGHVSTAPKGTTRLGSPHPVPSAISGPLRSSGPKSTRPVAPPRPASRVSLTERVNSGSRMGTGDGRTKPVGDHTSEPDMDDVDTSSMLSAFAGHVTQEALGKAVVDISADINAGGDPGECGNITFIPADHLTLVSRQDISAHNALEHVATSEGWWAVQQGKVYNCKTLAHIFSARLEEIQIAGEEGDSKPAEKPFRAGLFKSYMAEGPHCQKHGLIFLYLKLCGIDRTELEAEKHKAHVADIVLLSEEEHRCEVLSTLDNVKHDLDESMGTLRLDVHIDFFNLVVRQQTGCLRRKPVMSQRFQHGGDMNFWTFNLPEDVEASDLRPWSKHWEPFDFELEPWCSDPEEDCDVGDRDAVSLSDVVRSWLNDWQEFVTELGGEAGWRVIEQGLIKRDEPTESQMEILASRERRTDLDDVERMGRRRQALSDYFIKKYQWDPSKLEPFTDFTKNLQENQTSLLSLSE